MESTSAAAPKRRGKVILQRHGMDFPLFIAVMLVCAFGLVMMYSASYYYGLTSHNDGLYFLKRQFLFAAIGTASLYGLSHIGFRFYRKPWVNFLAYFGVVGLIFLTLAFPPINEARRWIPLKIFNLQPTELAKFVLVMTLANIMSRKVDMQNLIAGVFPCLIVFGLLCVPTILQPNLSMVVIFAIVTYVMLYLGGTRLSHRLLIVLIGLAAVAVLIKLKGYRMDRITSFINPDADPLGKGYQQSQARIALANGGLFGQGLNFSRQKLNFLPERESDYILAIIGEELGFVGVFALLAAYVFIIFRGINIAMRCPDRFGRLLAGGIVAVFAVQVLVNVGVASGALPATGQTLPFVSYGGTSMIVFLSAMGILLNISRYTEVNSENARRAKQPQE